jgi:hypothetical protein
MSLGPGWIFWNNEGSEGTGMIIGGEKDLKKGGKQKKGTPTNE